MNLSVHSSLSSSRRTSTDSICDGRLNPLVAAQNFVRSSPFLVISADAPVRQEYKMSNILDKPTESIFGYISVLRPSNFPRRIPSTDTPYVHSGSLLCVSVHRAKERCARDGSPRFVFQGRNARWIRSGCFRTSSLLLILYGSLMYESRPPICILQRIEFCAGNWSRKRKRAGCSNSLTYVLASHATTLADSPYPQNAQGGERCCSQFRNCD